MQKNKIKINLENFSNLSTKHAPCFFRTVKLFSKKKKSIPEVNEIMVGLV